MHHFSFSVGRMQKTRGPPVRPRDHDYARLVTEAKVLHQLPISIEVRLPHVLEEAASLADQTIESLAAVMILLMGSEVLGQVVDPFRENGDLNLG
jgi:hypothetical protein